MFTKIVPRPIGSSREGSISFLTAKKINRQPNRIITISCHWNLSRFSYRISISGTPISR